MGCAKPIVDGNCNQYILETDIYPTKHNVLESINARSYDKPYTMPHIDIGKPVYSSFGSMTGAGFLNFKLIHKILKILSKKHFKNLKTNIRKTIKKEIKK